MQAAREAARRAQCINNLKQIGLATLNFESTYGTLPPKGQVLATPDLNADAQAAIPNISASYLTLILPYMEQSVIYNQINLNQAASDTANIPPCTGPGAIHSGKNSVYSAAINTFHLPVVAGPRHDQLLQRLLGALRRRRRRRLHARVLRPRPAACQNLNPPPTQIWGRTDYFPIPGLHNTALQAAGMSPAYIAAVGEGKDSGTITGPLITGTIRMASITDGTSNTHDGLGVRLEADRLQRIPADLSVRRSTACPSTASSSPSAAAGGAWADNFTYSSLAGAQGRQNGIRGGTCMVNCTSNNEIYSFHPGGANALFVDGSVHFIKDVASVQLIAALVTRAGGEIISADQY